MAKCEDCETPVVWLRKPDGGWLPPVEPLFDFAYNDHYTATIDGIAQPVPQVYKRHECLTWEQRQLKMLEREREKQELIAADRARRAEEARIQEELAEARRAQEEAERKLREEVDRHERERRARQAARRREKQAERALEDCRDHRFPKRLLAFPCRDCDAEVDEPCRTDLWRTQVEPFLWWSREGHTSRYVDAPPDDRSRLVAVERWGDDYDHDESNTPVGLRGRGSTPQTVGPWPPSKHDPGRYDMIRFLRRHYVDVFEPEKRWLTDEEQETLTGWLANFGDLFEEVSDGPGDVDAGCGLPGPEGVRGGHAEREGGLEAEGDRVDPGERRGSGKGDGEHEDRGEGVQ